MSEDIYGSQYNQAGQGVGQLIAALIAHRMRAKENAIPLGAALGYPAVPSAGPGPITPAPGPMPPMPVGAPNPLAVAPTPRVMGAGGVPDVMTFPSAPTAIQPIMGRTVGQLKSLKDALGEPTMRDIFGTIGVTRTPGSVLEWDDATQSFKIKEGTKTVRSQDANVIVRQKELTNKENLQGWRDAVEKRLAKGQMTREEMMAMKSDLSMIDFALNPQFDMLDETAQDFIRSNLTASINRLKQRGVTVYTGPRQPKKPAAGAPAPAPAAPGPKKTPSGPTETPSARRMRRYSEIKKQYPDLNDSQIAAQIAQEEDAQGL